GNDTFVFASGDGADTITDFAAGADILDLSGYGFADQAAMEAATVQDGANVVITSGTDSITVLNATRADVLTAAGVASSGGGGAPVPGQEIIGSNYNDTLSGTAGNDTMNGYKGDDLLQGGDGDDTMQGALGNDTLDGGTGDDSLTGFGGNDTFVFASGDGADTITDFAAGADILDLSGYGFADQAAMEAATVQDGANVVITSGTDSITVLNALEMDVEDSILF
ncbi:calcium-binding protein, partial [Roseobacter sp. HKCCA0434]|uniref:calcium-binding protein n=1 Tax=Roseobacter sp. HKCCA0434 TaxID=3079297 RepID=UPI003967955F